MAFVAGVTYLGARAFTSEAADERAAEEARSFAVHSSMLATGDAFNGYLQILLYSEDSIVRTRAADEAARRDAMQQLLWLNTNRMESLAVVDRSGLVLVTTDDSIKGVRGSVAFNNARANLGPANSDIVLPEPGKPGYVEYAAPLRDGDGTVWGFLYARARPQVLWRDTLNATIDGGHNVIINSEGMFAAGVPDELLKQPWKGSPLENGSVRADVAGVDSICGLGAIGRDTQIDHGWFVASCLPASLMQIEASRALGNQREITIAGAVLAAVIAIGLLKLAFSGGRGGSAATLPADSEDEVDDRDESSSQADEAALAAAAATPPEPIFEHPPVAEGPLPVVVIADVDALGLIEAYERRNAAIAEEIRDSIQARLMIAAAQAEQAYKLAASDPDRAEALHRTAIEELESLRERELRGLGQELHPSIVRLGLPAALRSLRKEFDGRISIDLAIAADVDGASSRGGRTTIDPQLRVVLYRIVRDAVRAAVGAGAAELSIGFERDGGEVSLSVNAELDAEFIPPETLVADAIAIRAFAGTLEIAGDAMRISANVIAPHVEQPEPVIELVEPIELISAMDDNSDPQQPASGHESATGGEHALSSALSALVGELDLAIEVRLSSNASAEAQIDSESQDAVLAVARAAATGFAEAGAASCDLTLAAGIDGGTLSATGAAYLSVERLDAIRQAGERANCSVAIARDDVGVSITLGFDATDDTAPVTSFKLAEQEPVVIDVAKGDAAPVLPPAATTFTLPDEEPEVIEAGDDVATASIEEEELPKVVLISSLDEVISVNDDDTDDEDGDEPAPPKEPGDDASEDAA